MRRSLGTLSRLHVGLCRPQYPARYRRPHLARQEGHRHRRQHIHMLMKMDTRMRTLIRICPLGASCSKISLAFSKSARRIHTSRQPARPRESSHNAPHMRPQQRERCPSHRPQPTLSDRSNDRPSPPVSTILTLHRQSRPTRQPTCPSHPLQYPHLHPWG
jgi:hypothetical protein